MKLPFEFEEINIQDTILKHHGIKNINLDTPANVRNTVNTILNFLDLEDILIVEDELGVSEIFIDNIIKKSVQGWHRIITFSLAATNNSTKEQFQSAIKKFQQHIIQTTSTIDDPFAQFNNFASNVPSGLKIFIGHSDHHEQALKALSGFPNHWFFHRDEDYHYAINLFEHLKKMGYNIHEAEEEEYGHVVYAFAK